jgi:hypothetical protein
MSKSYRIRTQVGVDRQINVQLDQDFDQIEILSLKIRSEDVYTRMCADYGVVVGRVFANGGYGIPNAKLSIFVPITDEDLNNEIIRELYPYETIEDVNEDGYRYNLLPYESSHSGHVPTGTFPSKNDILTNPALIQVYDKYYKYTVKTNGSGDFMIMGVPTGTQTLVMNLDLSDMGPFSLSPQDLVRMGRASSSDFNSATFSTSSDFQSLPQIVTLNQSVNVQPFWGQPELCEVGIVRYDFNLGDVGVTIEPTALFMGSLVTNQNDQAMSRNCVPPSEMGDLCNLNAGPGEIVAIRQTIFQDTNGLPILEQAELPNGGKVIDEDGTWLLEVPMNLDYVTTNEFGEQVLSQDPEVGVPTQGKYRFKVKWDQSPSLELSETRRAYFLVPNIKEYGWNNSSTDPAFNLNTSSSQYQDFIGSYYFGLDWSGYTNVSEAVNCEDTFYNFQYNKVYTISGLVDQYYKGLNRGNFLGIKEITDNTCADENNKFPATDAVRNFDFLFFVTNLFFTFFSPLAIVIIPILHLIAQFWPQFKWIIRNVIPVWLFYNGVQSLASSISLLINGIIPASIVAALYAAIYFAATRGFVRIVRPLLDNFTLKQFQLPMLSYPTCDACECSNDDIILPEITNNIFIGGATTGVQKLGPYRLYNQNSSSLLLPSNSPSTWGELNGDPGDTEPVGIDPDLYSGNSNKQNNKYQADLTGFYYGLAGYPLVDPLYVQPSNNNVTNFLEYGRGKVNGTPVVRTYSDNDELGIVGRDITLSQSLNLMNLRERYFENESVIITTINPTTTTSQPYTDMPMILVCQPGTTLSAGDVISFRDPEQQFDPNYSGQSTNQFGSNSITGTSVSGLNISTNVTYIQPNGTVSTSQVYMNITNQDRDYNFKTGLEYFQVITSDNAESVYNNLSSNPSLLRKYLFDKQQQITYIDAGGSVKNVTLNSFFSIGDSWKEYVIVFLTRGVDPWTERQEISYDLSKLYGFSLGSGVVGVTSSYYMNVPIQPNTGSGSWYNSYKTPESHIEPYATSKIFFKPFNFIPDPNQFTSVQTFQPRFYSSLDKSTTSFRPYNGDKSVGQFLNSNISDNGVVLQQMKFFDVDYQGVVEGGTLIGSSDGQNQQNLLSMDSRLYSPSYRNFPTIQATNITFISGINNAKLVMRSDRLPSSDGLQITTFVPYAGAGNTMMLHQNSNFIIYSIASDGEGTLSRPFSFDLGIGSQYEDSGLNNNFDRVLDTFSCAGMVPLKCYTVNSNGELEILDPCPANEDPVRVQGGCYDLLSPDENGNYIRTIRPAIENYFEWAQRFRLTFAICRGVFSHIFVNSWVNGTLFAFPFRNKPTFDSNNQLEVRKVITVPTPFGPQQKVSYSFCSDTIAFEPNSNNFYYRSSPWNGTKFIGKKAPVETGTIVGGASFTPLNKYNLLFPTTIMDLGPKYFWTKDVNLSPDYYGYQMDKMNTTTWNEVTNLIQLFTISRLVNISFLESIFSSGDAALTGYFSRDGQRVDGDYAQMLQINSQYGVSPLNEGNYVDDPTIAGDNPIYITSDLQGNPVFGVYYNSYPSDRDLISPRRIDRNTTGSTLIADYLGTKSQLVPFYNWRNNGWSNTPENSIFGNDKNSWYTDYNNLLNLGNNIYSEKYQELDRLNAPYFLGNNGLIQNQQGYIFQRNASGSTNQYDPQNTSPNNFSTITSAPWYFYFGLKVGRTAMDKFRQSYIGGE